MAANPFFARALSCGALEQWASASDTTDDLPVPACRLWLSQGVTCVECWRQARVQRWHERHPSGVLASEPPQRTSGVLVGFALAGRMRVALSDIPLLMRGCRR